MWDLQINLQTGDLVFNGNRDLAGAMGDSVFSQRIHNRIKVEKGTFIYNSEFGSRLRGGALRGQSVNAEQIIIPLIQEALEPMNDISIINIDVEPSEVDARQVLAHITYKQQPLISPDEFTSDTEATIEETVAINLQS